MCCYDNADRRGFLFLCMITLGTCDGVQQHIVSEKRHDLILLRGYKFRTDRHTREVAWRCTVRTSKSIIYNNEQATQSLVIKWIIFMRLIQIYREIVSNSVKSNYSRLNSFQGRNPSTYSIFCVTKNHWAPSANSRTQITCASGQTVT